MQSAVLTKGFETNKHWFEVWSIETNGSLDKCINFYDAAFENVAAWVANCFKQESDRTEETLVVIHASVQEGAISRTILPSVQGENIYQTVKKFRSALI